jgi:hypothetical protein
MSWESLSRLVTVAKLAKDGNQALSSEDRKEMSTTAGLACQAFHKSAHQIRIKIKYYILA